MKSIPNQKVGHLKFMIPKINPYHSIFINTFLRILPHLNLIFEKFSQKVLLSVKMV